MIELLREAWKRHPYFRLCQLICNCAYDSLDKEAKAKLHDRNQQSGIGPGFDPFFVGNAEIGLEIEKLARASSRA